MVSPNRYHKSSESISKSSKIFSFGSPQKQNKLVEMSNSKKKTNSNNQIESFKNIPEINSNNTNKGSNNIMVNVPSKGMTSSSDVFKNNKPKMLSQAIISSYSETEDIINTMKNPNMFGNKGCTNSSYEFPGTKFNTEKEKNNMNRDDNMRINKKNINNLFTELRRIDTQNSKSNKESSKVTSSLDPNSNKNINTISSNTFGKMDNTNMNNMDTIKC